MRIICSAPVNVSSDRLVTALKALGANCVIAQHCVRAVYVTADDQDPLGTQMVKLFEEQPDHSITVLDQTAPTN